MNIYNKLLMLILIVLLASCQLKHSNPLDPANSNHQVPYQPTNITFLVSGVGVQPKFVKFTWRANSSDNTDGYYIYRGLSYNSTYALVGEKENVPDPNSENELTVSFTHLGTDIDPIYPGDYYYKISAYKQYNGRRLEGKKSEYVFVRIP